MDNQNNKNNKNNKQGISFILLVTVITSILVIALFQFQGMTSAKEITERSEKYRSRVTKS